MGSGGPINRQMCGPKLALSLSIYIYVLSNHQTNTNSIQANPIAVDEESVKLHEFINVKKKKQKVVRYDLLVA